MGPPKEVRPSRVATQRISRTETCLWMGRILSVATSTCSFIVLSDFFQRTLSDFQRLERGFQILARVSFKKFAALDSQPFYDLVPLLRLTMRFGIRLMRNLSTTPCMFEGFFHRVFGNFEGEHAVSEVLVTSFFMDRL